MDKVKSVRETETEIMKYKISKALKTGIVLLRFGIQKPEEVKDP